jgi:hypothetical protein
LIRHDHQTPVPQALRARVHLPLLQPHNLFDRLNLHIVQQRLSRRLTNVEEFSSKREDTVVVATDDGESGDGEGFGGVSFGEDEGALGTVLGAGVMLMGKEMDVDQRVVRERMGDQYRDKADEREEEGRTGCACFRPSSSASDPA